MRGSLRITSVTGIVLFLGWSLLAQAREWMAPPVPTTNTNTRTARSRVPPAPTRPAVEPRVWN
ncbi:MAG TPA: hypothetical protein VGL81_20500 [Polyangiaceae bacterium]|jgi:hypothetical protein